jgi:hypothetical protein
MNNNGPWSADNIEMLNGVLRHGRGDAGRLFPTDKAYRAAWDSPINYRGLRDCLEVAVSRFGVLDPTDGAEPNRQSVAI